MQIDLNRQMQSSQYLKPSVHSPEMVIHSPNRVLRVPYLATNDHLNRSLELIPGSQESLLK
jgi:hypothetical protein